MQVHRTLPTSPILGACALTTGTFDGVHRGHQMLIERLKNEADARHLATAALTFDDMPICLLRPEVCPSLLTLPDEKIAAFSATPLDHLFIVPFTRAIAGQDARSWMARWVQTIGLKLFVGGPDFALGRDREGTIGQLRHLGDEMGFEALALDEKLIAGELPVSSTRARAVVECGEVERVPSFLGRFYRLSGRVVSGQQLGRTIGAPTINIEPHPRKCVPANGVYAIRAHFDGHSYAAACNIGVRPTVEGTRRQIEFHVLNRSIETAPAHAEIEFIARLRDEQKFPGLDALKTQMQRDFKTAATILSIPA